MDRNDHLSSLDLARDALETRRALLERFSEPVAKLQDFVAPQVAQLEAAASTQKAFERLAVDQTKIDTLLAAGSASAEHFRDILKPQIAQAEAALSARALFESVSADTASFSKLDSLATAIARREAELADVHARIYEALQPASVAAEAFNASMAKNSAAIEELRQRSISPVPRWEIESVPRPWLELRPVRRRPADEFLAQVMRRIATWRASLPKGKVSYERLLFQGFAIDQWTMMAVDADLIAVQYHNEDGGPVEVLIAPAAIVVELSAEDEETVKVQLLH